jgi:hypothetical protein
MEMIAINFLTLKTHQACIIVFNFFTLYFLMPVARLLLLNGPAVLRGWGSLADHLIEEEKVYKYILVNTFSCTTL